MTFTPSIQSMVGTHSSGGLGVVDWPNQRMFQVGSSYTSRYGLITGLEQAFVSNTNVGATGFSISPDGPGLQASGGIFVGAGHDIFGGAAFSLTPDFTGVTYIVFPASNEPGGTHIGVTWASTQYDFCTGPGNNVIPVLNRVQELSSTIWLAEQDNVSAGCRACAGAAGTGIVYTMGPKNSTSGPATLSIVQFDGAGFVSNTVVGTIAITAVDPAWTGNFACSAMCLDKTDNKLIVLFTGTGGGAAGRICKVNPTTVAIEWNSVLPNTDGGGPVLPGDAFSWSDIRHQRVGFYSGSPATATIYNTSDGSVDNTYTTGLNGLHINVSAQAYSDSLGCVVLTTDFTNGAGSPTRLNSTPTSWSDGWAALYLAAPITPVLATNTHATQLRIWGNYHR